MVAGPYATQLTRLDVNAQLEDTAPDDVTPAVVDGFSLSVLPFHDDKLRNWRDKHFLLGWTDSGPLTAVAQRDVEASTFLVLYALDFSDAEGLVTSRQSGAWGEKITLIQRPDGIPHPDLVSYLYDEVEEARSRPCDSRERWHIRHPGCPPGSVRRPVTRAARRVAVWPPASGGGLG